MLNSPQSNTSAITVVYSLTIVLNNRFFTTHLLIDFALYFNSGSFIVSDFL